MTSFLTLFKSKSTREMEAKIRFRRGKGRVQKYVQEAQQSSERYWKLSCEAYRLGDQEQFRLIGSHYLRLRETIVRWQRFLVKLEALELRRNEVSATREFLQSIDELTSAINRGASPQEIARMQVDMERAIEKSKAQEEMLDVAMEAAGTSFEGDFPASDGAFAEMERSIAGALGQETRNATAGRSIQGSTAKLDREVGRAIQDLANSGNFRNPQS